MKVWPATVAAILLAGLAGPGATAAQGATSSGVITTVAGGAGRGLARNISQSPSAVTTGPGGVVYEGDSDDGGGVVREFTSQSSLEKVIAGVAGSAPGYAIRSGPAGQARLASVNGLVLDHAGNLLISDGGNGLVRVLARTSGTFYGQPMVAGDMYTIAGGGGFGTDSGEPATSDGLDFPQGLAVDGSGNVLIADSFHDMIRVVAVRSETFYGQAMTAGDIYNIAGTGTGGYSGDGGPATSAELDEPGSVAVDAAGNVLIADTVNDRVRVVAAATGTFYGQAMTAGDIYTIAGSGPGKFSGDGGPATQAVLSGPQAVAVDSSGNVLIADTGDNRVRVVAAATGTFYGHAMTAGDIYTLASAPGTSSLAVDAAGNVVITVPDRDRVRVIAGSSGTFYRRHMNAGALYDLAGNGTLGPTGAGGPAVDAQLQGVAGISADTDGNFVTDEGGIGGGDLVQLVAGSSGSFFGQLMTAGDIYTIAGAGPAGYSGDGGPGTLAEVSQPLGLAFDSTGNVIIADAGNNRVRVVAAATGTFYGQAMSIGDIYTIAGDGATGYSGDGGPATSAELNGPAAVALDAYGNVVINDAGNYRVRVVAATTGTFYGQAMTAGDIYTIAGDGASGYSGDGGPATSAKLNTIGFYNGVSVHGGLAVDSAGDVIIADTGNWRIRIVAARSGTAYGQAMTAGDIYTVAGDGSPGFAGDRGPAVDAELRAAGGVAVDSAGNLLIADGANDRIRMVAAQSGTFYGRARTAGYIYTIAGNGQRGFLGDTGPATSARLNVPVAVAASGSANVLIADNGNDRVRLVSG